METKNQRHFSNPQTLEDLKKQYRELAFKHHPDRGGSTETMKAVNNEYDELFKILKDIHRTKDGETYTAKQETSETSEQFRDIINELVKMDDNIIEIIGCFIWVTGNTRTYKDKLKELKFQWHSKKVAMREVKNFLIALKSNWIYILWCMVYFTITWLMIGGRRDSFLITLCTYIISMAVALSPLGEMILRFIYGVRKIETKREKEYLLPIFEEVYDTVKQSFPKSKKIRLYITDDMYANAFALGRKTVAVTKGAMQTLSDEELKGIIAHEIGHILKGHTTALLLTTVGNGIFMFIIICNKIVMGVMSFFAAIFDHKGYVKIFFMLLGGLFNIVLLIFLFLGQAILAANSRKNEYQADGFAYET